MKKILDHCAALIASHFVANGCKLCTCELCAAAERTLVKHGHEK